MKHESWKIVCQNAETLWVYERHVSLLLIHKKNFIEGVF